MNAFYIKKNLNQSKPILTIYLLVIFFMLFLSVYSWIGPDLSDAGALFDYHWTYSRRFGMAGMYVENWKNKPSQINVWFFGGIGLII